MGTRMRGMAVGFDHRNQPPEVVAHRMRSPRGHIVLSPNPTHDAEILVCIEPNCICAFQRNVWQSPSWNHLRSLNHRCP